MSVANYGLTSLASVREFLQKNPTEIEQDLILERLIERASKLMMGYCKREFAPATATSEEREFVYTGGEVLDLAPYDLRSVTSIEIDTDTSDPIVIDSADYFLRPKPAVDSVYQQVRLPGYGVTDSPGKVTEREVTIDGDWGFASVPDDVVHWCILTVAIWARRDVSAFSTTFSIDEDRLERPESLPSAVRAGLSHWRRVGIG